jgi:hypothetical protein
VPDETPKEQKTELVNYLLSVGSIDRTVFLQVVVDLEKAMGVVAEGCNGMGEGSK